MTLRELLIGVGVDFDDTGAKQADSAMSGLMSKGNSLIGTIAQIGAVLGIAFSVKAIIQTSDELTKLKGRINLVTKDMQKTKNTMTEIFDIAHAGGVKAAPIMDLFATSGLSLKKQGFTDKDIVGFAETLSQAGYVSGLDSTSNEALIRNLNQALSAGELKGKDVSDIKRIGGAPILDQIAKGLGVTSQQFYDMASAGQVSSKDVIKAFKNVSEEIRQQFNGMPKTVEGALARIGNAWDRLLFNLQETGVFTFIAEVLNKIADGMLIVAKNSDKVVFVIKLVALAVGSLAIAFGLLQLVALAKDFSFLIFAMKYYSVIAWRTAAATLAASWPFIALAIAIAFVILLIEDLYVWMEGGESLMGEWLGPWDEFAPKIQWLIDLWELFKKAILAFFSDDTKVAEKAWDDFISKLVEISIAGFQAIGRALWEYVLSQIPLIGDAINGFNSFVNSANNLGTNFGLDPNRGSRVDPAWIAAMNSGGPAIEQLQVNVTATSNEPGAIANATSNAVYDVVDHQFDY